VAPVEIDLLWNAVCIRPTGWHQLFSLRRSVEVPYEQIVSLDHRPQLARNGPLGLRMPGTNVPGYYTAGTYWRLWDTPRVRSFWVRRHPERTFTLELQGNYFDSVYVEVDDPDAQIERLRAAIVDQGTAETK
jgi:hypothetical protein